MNSKVLPVTVLSSSAKNITGKRFGKLVAVGPIRQNKQTAWIWLFRCDCGGQKICHPSKAKQTGSCRCDFSEKCAKANITHGESCDRNRTPEYAAWRNMKTRCQNPRFEDYHRYGGRGIKICDKWKRSFQAFLKDMGRRPSNRHSLDRIRNSEGYNCGSCSDCKRRGAEFNCRWATPVQQASNRRNNITATIDGREDTVYRWCDVLKVVDSGTAYYRIHRGMTPEKAVTTPISDGYKRREVMLAYKGQTFRLEHLAKQAGLNAATLNSRIKNGWSVERAVETPSKKRDIIIENGLVESSDAEAG